MGALRLEEEGLNPISHMKSESGVLAFLLCFLSVFKVQTSYDQFWQAMEYRDAVLHASRYIVIGACSMFKFQRPKRGYLKGERRARL